jgi:heptosyltransferase-2
VSALTRIAKAVSSKRQHIWGEGASLPESRAKISNILIIATGGIGDAIIGLPCIKMVNEYYPDSNLYILASPLTRDVLKTTAGISDFLEYPIAPDFRDLIKITRQLRSKNIDVVMGLRPSNLRSHALLVRLLNPKQSIKNSINMPEGLEDWQFWWSDLVSTNDNEHNMYENLDLLRPLGVDPRSRSYENLTTLCNLGLSEEEISRALRLYPHGEKDRVRIGFHPGCKVGWEFKQWKHEKFIRLADMLVEQFDADVFWFGGPEEKEMVSRIAGSMKNDSTSVAGALKLRETAALIASCRLFISNDSGLMHIATAVGVKTLGLFSNTNPRNDSNKTGPLGRKSCVISSEKTENITVEEVFSAVKRSLVPISA